jgi:hypothetical protein
MTRRAARRHTCGNSAAAGETRPPTEADYLFVLAAAAALIALLLHISTVMARRPSAQKTPCFMSQPRLWADAAVGAKAIANSAAAPTAMINAFMDAPLAIFARRKSYTQNEPLSKRKQDNRRA